jgi:hypothetical protein
VAETFGPFSVDPDEIARLGTLFTPFVNILLDTETASAGLNGYSLTTNYRENIGDKGVDAGISQGIQTRWIPKGDSAWQFKAGDPGPAGCAKELRGAERAQEILRSGGAYLLVIGAALTEAKTNTRRRRLIETAGSLGLEISEDSIQVLDANALARWAGEHPTIAAWRGLRGVGESAYPLERWSISQRYDSEWITSPSRTDLIERINAFIAEGSSDFRIEGVSGIGKSRSVLEALRGQPYEPLVLYLPSTDGMPAGLIGRLFDQSRSAIVVVDECDARYHETLAAQIPTSSTVRLITIGPIDQQMTQTAAIRLGPLEDDAVDRILRQNIPTLWPEARKVIVAVADGNVRYALVSASAVASQEGLTAADLISPDALRAFITNQLPDGAIFLACCCLALFTRIGYERELSVELDLIAQHLGFSTMDLRAAASHLDRVGLLTRNGRYRSVSPHPLAIYLAANGWSEFGDRIASQLLPALDSSMADRLFERASDVGNVAGGTTAIDMLIGSDGPLASLEALEAGGDSHLLTHLAVLAPDAILYRLSTMISDTSQETLRTMKSSRRQLVWSLQKLAWHARTFDQAADAMLRLGLAENETWSNNASATWIEFFGTFLPGTAARPDARLRYLQERATENVDEIRHRVAKACSHGLSHGGMMMVSGELQGGVVVEPRGTPLTWGEAWDYQRGLISILRRLSHDQDASTATAAAKSLVRAIHRYADDPEVRVLLFESIAELPQDGLRLTRRELNHLEGLYDRKQSEGSRDSGMVAGLQVLRQALPKTTPQEDLAILAHSDEWPIPENQTRQKLASAAAQLDVNEAVECLKNLLIATSLPAAFEVGWLLASLEPPEESLPWLVGTCAGSNFAALVGYLWARVEAGDTAAFENFLDGPVSEELPTDALVRVATRGPATGRTWQRVEDLAPELNITLLAQTLTGWVNSITPDQIGVILDLWLKKPMQQSDYNAAVDFIGLALHRHPEWIDGVDDQVAQLVSKRNEFPSIGREVHDWEELAGRQLHKDPLKLLELLLALIEAGHVDGDDPNDGGAVLGKALQSAGEAGWERIGQALTGPGWRVRMDLRGWITNHTDPLIVTKWIGDDLERARITASICSLGKDFDSSLDADETVSAIEMPSLIVRYLLQHFYDDDRVRGELYSQFVSGGWVGNESDRLAKQIEDLSAWIDSGEPLEVKKWARDTVANLRRDQIRVLEKEAESPW